MLCLPREGGVHVTDSLVLQSEVALDWMLMRVNDESKKPFGKLLREHGVILEWIAKSRIEIDAARLVVLNAAVKMDELGPKKALKEIAEAKVLIPQTALTVIDRAVQAFGGAGVSQDTPLARLKPTAAISSRLSVPPTAPSCSCTGCATSAPKRPPGASGKVASTL